MLYSTRCGYDKFYTNTYYHLQVVNTRGNPCLHQEKHVVTLVMHQEISVLDKKAALNDISFQASFENLHCTLYGGKVLRDHEFLACDEKRSCKKTTANIR